MARQFAMIVAETEYGTPLDPEDRVLGTNTHYFPITQSNAVNIQDTATIGTLQYGGGYNTRSCAHSAQSALTGTIQAPLYATPLTKFLLDLSFVQINSGRTLPFPTTDTHYVMPAKDLASFTLLYGHEQVDGSVKRIGYHGLKIMSGNVSLQSGQQTGGTMSYTVQGSGISTPAPEDFPEPSSSDFPCSVFTFSDLDGGLKIGSVRKSFGGVEVSWTNSMSVQYFESRYPQLIKYTGRETSVNVSNMYLKPTPDDHASYKSLTPFVSQVKLVGAGSKTLTFDLPITRWMTLTHDYSLENPYYRNGTLGAFFDPSIGTDITVTASL
jgi:hypothetical protein